MIQGPLPRRGGTRSNIYAIPWLGPPIGWLDSAYKVDLENSGVKQLWKLSPFSDVGMSVGQARRIRGLYRPGYPIVSEDCPLDPSQAIMKPPNMHHPK